MRSGTVNRVGTLGTLAALYVLAAPAAALAGRPPVPDTCKKSWVKTDAFTKQTVMHAEFGALPIPGEGDTFNRGWEVRASGDGIDLTIRSSIVSAVSGVVPAGWTTGPLLEDGTVLTLASVRDYIPEMKATSSAVYSLLYVPLRANADAARAIAASPIRSYRTDFGLGESTTPLQAAKGLSAAVGCAIAVAELPDGATAE